MPTIQLPFLRPVVIFVLGSVLAVGGLLWGLNEPPPAVAVDDHAPGTPAVNISGTVQIFKATLSGTTDISTVITLPLGAAVFALATDQRTFHYRVLPAASISVTAAHLELGAAGNHGAITQPLTIGVDSTISGTLIFTPSQLAKLQGGSYSLTLQISRPISAVVQGQIISFTPPSTYLALLTGASERPTVTTDARGIGHFTLTNRATLSYHIAVSRITTITTAHIHQGPVGVNGAPVHTLYTGTGVFDANHPLTGSVLLDAQDLVDLLTGYSYVNLHTSAHPKGEVRGQIVENSLLPRLFLSLVQTPAALPPPKFFNIVIVSKCERQPAGTWFEGTTSIEGVPDNGHLVAFSYAADGPIVATILSGPHRGYPFWKTGYYSHIIGAGVPRAGTWYVWIVDDKDQRISEIGSWQSTGPGEGCNQAVVDFDSRK